MVPINLQRLGQIMHDISPTERFFSPENDLQGSLEAVRDSFRESILSVRMCKRYNNPSIRACGVLHSLGASSRFKARQADL